MQLLKFKAVKYLENELDGLKGENFHKVGYLVGQR